MGHRYGRPTLAAALVVVTLVASTLTASFAAAANRPDFPSGNIIADAVFFDSNAMSVNDVASFIAAKGASCVPGPDGTPCLKDFFQDTWTRSASGCPYTYPGATGESAAAIVYKVAQVCGVSPRVLLVLLQKEQSLITDSGSSLFASRYRSATGYGCPDTAPCDSQYYGFFNQVFLAARQFKLYAEYPTRYGYIAGQYNQIAFSPNSACGSAAVYIQNTATAALYNYTPYQPDTAALFGGGDGCSSWGNLNFWSYFVDWFGTTQSVYSVTGAFLSLWSSLGYSASALGVPTSSQVSGLRDSGSYQNFAGGAIYSSPASGTHYVTTLLASAWARAGWENGVLGYPTSDPVGGLKNGGQYQNFQGGEIYWSPSTGAHYVTSAFTPTWASATWEQGVLGYPTSDPVGGSPNGGSYQNFQGGAIYSSPTAGTHYVTGPFMAAWAPSGWERGALGYPTANPVAGSSGTTQTFERGQIGQASGGKAIAMSDAIRGAWEHAGGAGGVLGSPTSSTVGGLVDGGTFQNFTNGSVHASPATGAHFTTGSFDALWAQSGWETGALGYPVADPVTDATTGSIRQNFQRGSISASSAAAEPFLLSQAIAAEWDQVGGTSGVLGSATSSTVNGLTGGGSFQNFLHGAIHASPATGAHYTAGPIGNVWASSGWEQGPLGYPTSDPVGGLRNGGTYQNFARGAIYSAPSTGTHYVAAPFIGLWGATGWENGVLGYPTSNPVNGLVNGGSYQNFAAGSIHTSPATGTHYTQGAIEATWAATGWENGVLGYPTSDPVAGLRDGGSYQTFASGSVYSSPATGAHWVTGAVLAAWGATGWERGTYGYPVGNPVTLPSGQMQQQFQGGVITAP